MALLGGKKDEAPSKPLFRREEESVSQRTGEVHTLLGKGSEFIIRLPAMTERGASKPSRTGALVPVGAQSVRVPAD